MNNEKAGLCPRFFMYCGTGKTGRPAKIFPFLAELFIFVLFFNYYENYFTYNTAVCDLPFS